MKAVVAAVSILGAALVLAGGAPPALAQTPPAPPPTVRAATPPPVAGARIAFVDLPRVMARSAAGVAAREQLEREKATMQREIDGRRTEIDKLQEELEKRGPLMTPEARRDREDQLERRRRDAVRMADDFQRELSRKEQLLAQRVLQELRVIIERLGKERGFHMILEARNAGVLYGAPEADVTDEVIRAYDQESAARGRK
jgi:outer membrane protein